MSRKITLQLPLAYIDAPKYQSGDKVVLYNHEIVTVEVIKVLPHHACVFSSTDGFSFTPTPGLVVCYECSGESGGCLVKEHEILGLLDDEMIDRIIQEEIKKRLPGMRDAIVNMVSGKVGYVYLMANNNGECKIGTTRTLHQRLRQIKSDMQSGIELLCVIYAGYPYRLERDLHCIFTHKRLHGEWFDLDDADIDFIKSLAVQDE